MNLSLSEIIALLMKRFVFIVVSIFLGLFIFFVFNSYIIKPTYTASLQMYVGPSELESVADLSEFYYAQEVVTTYINFLQTKTFYNQVIKKSGFDYTSDQLKEMTSIQALDNTVMFKISVTSNSPKDSFQIAQAIQTIAPDLIKSIKTTTKINVVDPAVLPTEPSGPDILLNTIIGGFLGFLISILTIFLWEIMNIKVKGQEDLRKKYDIPILGAIPSYKKIKIMKQGITDNTQFMLNEAYHSLSSNIRFTIRKEGCKKIIISSPIRDDGKSTTSVNLAIALAQTGSKVLLLDCDLRKGTLHHFLNVKSEPGISDTLSGMSNDIAAVQNTSYHNLQVITMGTIPPNPAELLGSIQMEELMKELEKAYEYIIIDSPPINIVSDALSLVAMTDGVVLVVREGSTTHPDIVSAVNKYKFSEAKLLGFVINDVAFNHRNIPKTQYYYTLNQQKPKRK